ncbi:ABC transporter permease [Falcatimonas sp. MSJ-15]|uniref:ABC transporter permease n=1 Tax=Falcatimonas sp. MSJ-15 TaxID=2841515 RepID=UPI001C11B228|nr:ABC transporter permease [Falcatimonas sp. MSJ-15]MBU5470451.1 ABC transporter permease [Falcatimonas sp. MSJ-15]
MVKYVIKRLLLAIPIFIGITIFVFVLSNMAPGSPADIIAASSGEMSEEALEELKVSMGLDKPVVVRYFLWLNDLCSGDLGTSTRTNQPVSQMIGQRIGPSLTLTLTSVVVALLISIPLGVIAAIKPYSFWDNLSSAIAFIGTSTPNFFISLVLIYIFSVKLGIFPSQGMYNSGEMANFPSLCRHLVLPVIVMAIQMMGNFIKQTRGSVLEVLNEEYIKTARAKGIKEIRVTIKHALRNALIPIVTSVGLTVPFLIGGAVITEQIFSWPGIGSLMIQSISTRDYNAIMGITVMISLAVILVNIFLDVLYSYLDPRISYE